jgi:hypothetical protein
MTEAVRSKAATTAETDNDLLSSSSALSHQVLASHSTRRSAGSSTRGSSATSAIHVNSTTAVSPHGPWSQWPPRCRRRALLVRKWWDRTYDERAVYTAVVYALTSGCA